jgi:hypothetical protein
MELRASPDTLSFMCIWELKIFGFKISFDLKKFIIVLTTLGQNHE